MAIGALLVVAIGFSAWFFMKPVATNGTDQTHGAASDQGKLPIVSNEVSSDDQSKTSIGVIVGSVVGVAVLAIAAALAVAFFTKKRGDAKRHDGLSFPLDSKTFSRDPNHYIRLYSFTQMPFIFNDYLTAQKVAFEKLDVKEIVDQCSSEGEIDVELPKNFISASLTSGPNHTVHNFTDISSQSVANYSFRLSKDGKFFTFSSSTGAEDDPNLSVGECLNGALHLFYEAYLQNSQFKHSMNIYSSFVECLVSHLVSDIPCKGTANLTVAFNSTQNKSLLVWNFGSHQFMVHEKDAPPLYVNRVTCHKDYPISAMQKGSAWIRNTSFSQVNYDSENAVLVLGTRELILHASDVTVYDPHRYSAMNKAGEIIRSALGFSDSAMAVMRLSLRPLG
jgi:hypothetical protein